MKDGHKKRKSTSKVDSDGTPAKKKSTTSTTASTAAATAAASATAAKKDTNPTSSTSSSSGSSSKDKEESSSQFKPLSLQDIHDRIRDLVKQVPEIPKEGFYVEGEAPNATSSVIGKPPDNLKKALIKSWASKLQVVLEELGLLLCCVSTATYRWGTDRSGAADQNLTLLNEELNSTQDQIASRVTPRLRNVLTPVVDLVVERTITTKTTKKRLSQLENGGGGAASPVVLGGSATTATTTTTTTTTAAAMNGENDNNDEDDNNNIVEVKQNVFTRHLEDPDFVHLCYEILARNASMMRLVVITNFQKMQQVIRDYLAAQNNDTQHHREFAY